MSAPTLALTGVTGAVGGLVAAALAGRGVPLRLLARDPGRVAPLPGATVVAASYGDAAQARAALAGVETLLMVSASESADRLDQHRRFVDAAAAAGVQHVVYTSFLGAGPDATFTLVRDHGATEGHLRAAVPHVTALRDSLYADFFAELAGADGVLRGPAGDGQVAPVARADVARAATAVLRDPLPHRDRTYQLTGPELVTFARAAEVLTEVTGRPVRYLDETLEQAYASRASYGAPDWQVAAWVSTYTAVAAGELAVLSDDVERLTGRRPQTLPEVLRARLDPAG